MGLRVKKNFVLNFSKTMHGVKIGQHDQLSNCEFKLNEVTSQFLSSSITEFLRFATATVSATTA